MGQREAALPVVPRFVCEIRRHTRTVEERRDMRFASILMWPRTASASDAVEESGSRVLLIVRLWVTVLRPGFDDCRVAGGLGVLAVVGEQRHA
jgi:hypothetical protein